MATDVGVEILHIDGPIDPNCGSGTSILEWIKSMGATVVKYRNHAYDSAGRQADYNFTRDAIMCTGLKLITRPGPSGDCGEGVPLWDSATGDIHGCAQNAVHRWYDVINAVAGGGNESKWWKAHILANEPNNTSAYPYNDSSAVSRYKDDLKRTAQKIVANGWQWIPFATPAMSWPLNGSQFYEATVQAFNESGDMHSAFKYFGFHLYWCNDTGTGSRDELMGVAIDYAKRAGKGLLVDELNIPPLSGAPDRCSGYNPDYNACYDGMHCVRTASIRHAFYTLRNDAPGGLVIFLLTGDSTWKTFNLGPCGGCTSGQIDAEQYRWAMEAGKLA